MLKEAIHALASSESSETPFFVVLILPVRDDTPWNSTSILGHNSPTFGNMSTLIRMPTGHMRFVPAQCQSDDTTATLSPAKWLVEFVLISNTTGH